jgi:integrase
MPSGAVHPIIPGDEVKNGRELSYELSAASTELLDLYLAKGRPVFLGEPSDYLFPASDGGPRNPQALAELIKRTIREQIGLTIHPHLFRSIAGRIHNLASPGDFATIAHVIGDTIETTMAAYGQHERQSAIRHYQGSVDKARTDLAMMVRPRRRTS